MPTDVPIGQGYMGDVLFGAFPGQYRDTVQGPNAMAQPAAQTFVQQVRTDPDQGRPMALMDMPGVGKVMVPADQVMAQRTCFPAPEPSLDGFEGLDDLGKMKQGANVLGQAAGHAAQQAVHALRGGALKSWADVEAHVKGKVDAARAQIEARLRSRIAKLPAIAAQAVAHALSVVRPHADAILKGRNMGCPPYKNCGTDGMGDLGETQSFYTALNTLQNHFIQMHAEVQAIGEDAWDEAVHSGMETIETRGWKPYSNFFFKAIGPYVLGITKSLLITHSRPPDSAKVAAAQSQAAGLRRLIDTVKGFLPAETKATADQTGAEVKARLDKITGLKSPPDAAADSLKNDLVSAGSSITKYVVIGASIIGGALILPKILGLGDIGDVLTSIGIGSAA